LVEIDVRYEGDLHCEARHGPSGARLQTDAPRDNHGRGESFSPTDLLATALASCVLTVMAIAGRKRGIELGPARAKVKKHMVSEPRRRVGRLELSVEVEEEHAAEARRLFEAAAHGCPVHASLDPAVTVELHLRFGAGPE